MKSSTLVVLLTLLPMTASRADQRVPDDFEVTTFAGGFLVLRLHFIGDKVTCNRPKCVTFR